MNNSNKDMIEAVHRLFNQRDQYILIGLTGRTGSGCSSAASILESEFPEINLRPPFNPLPDNEKRKYNIIYEWASKKWKKFTRINASSIIVYYICKLTDEEIEGLLKIDNFSSQRFYDDFKNNIEEIRKLSRSSALEEIENVKDASIDDMHKLFFSKLPSFVNFLKNYLYSIKPSLYTEVMQKAGDNIRSSGSAACSDFDAKNVYSIPETINKIIKIARKFNQSHGLADYFVIDAIRHPYEVEFFRRYSAFYLIAITTEENNRIKRLHALEYTDKQIKDLSEKEYPEENSLNNNNIFASQNIAKCLELADIIVENPNEDHGAKKKTLNESMVKYISLIQHPGLTAPNRIERCMQVAITAKLNSGCISRQVGAVVADSSYSIRSIGWNSAPEGQVPCNLRNIKRRDDESDLDSFSDFERDLDDDKFKDDFLRLPHFNQDGYSIDGRPLCYCFKSIYNKSQKKDNQVHTRALHAEENAFLQLSKYGSQSINGGVLFTTASPCELCSKKAYHLGIEYIYYIDPYPGIANKHILSCGKLRPQLSLYTGAVGRAYVQLYQPLIPLKDELGVLLSE